MLEIGAPGSREAVEEAEYAWLPVDCLKPFGIGDGSGAGDGSMPIDGTLQACVAAAERAVEELEKQRIAAAAAAAAAAERGEELSQRHSEDKSDSDGGACAFIGFAALNIGPRSGYFCAFQFFVFSEKCLVVALFLFCKPVMRGVFNTVALERFLLGKNLYAASHNLPLVHMTSGSFPE